MTAIETAPRLGPGVVYCEPLHPLFEQHADLIAVAEVEPSSFWIKAPGPAGAIRSNLATLDRIAALPQAKLVHGVGFPIGGTLCDSSAHIAEQRRWAERLDAPWTSEHLSFNETGAGAAGFLLPPAQTEAGVALAARNIRARAAALGDRPFAFETGVNYLAPRAGELPDGEYFAAVAEAADCRILLDLHNLWANERNGRAGVEEVFRALPLERVVEVHLAGGMEKDGYWLDAHCGPVPAALLDLAADLVAELPNLGAILFELSPQFAPTVPPAVVVAQIEALHRLWERAGSRGSRSAQRRSPRSADQAPEAHESALVMALAGPVEAGEEPALALYRTLVASFRNGTLADLLPQTLRLLSAHVGEAGLEDLLAAYRRSTPPPLFPADEALGFAAWLSANGSADPYVADLLALETGIVRLVSEGRGGELVFRHDPSAIVAALETGVLPSNLPEGEHRLWIGQAATQAAA